MNVRNVVRIGGQALAIGGVVRALRAAREKGDRLELLDAVLSAMAIATSIAIIVREIREDRADKHSLDPRDHV